MLVWITEKIKFGASYRSEVSHHISNGKINFSPQESTGIPGVDFFNTGGRGSIRTPAIALLGLAWTKGPLTLEFGAQWTEWSSFDKIAINFDEPVAGESGIEIPKKWRNVWEYRFGMQYSLNEYLDLRAGFSYDEGPIPAETLDPGVPYGDRWYYTAGIGVKFKRLTIDTTYMYMQGEDSTWNNSIGDPPIGGALMGLQRVTGKFEDVDGHFISLTVSYKF
jgi:long-chain fatty acid transport protein